MVAAVIASNEAPKAVGICPLQALSAPWSSSFKTAPIMSGNDH
jgi:hypothetical protein